METIDESQVLRMGDVSFITNHLAKSKFKRIGPDLPDGFEKSVLELELKVEKGQGDIAVVSTLLNLY